MSERLKASNNPVASRTLLQSYAGKPQYFPPAFQYDFFSLTALPARTRLALSLGMCGIAAAGLLMSNFLEEKYPANGSSQKQEM